MKANRWAGEPLAGWALGVGAFGVAMAVYVTTLLPGIGDRDTAELQRVAYQLAVAHPTGYPLYTLLGWLWTHLLPFGSVAWRMNLLSALYGAAAVLGLWATGRSLGQAPLIAAAAALSLAFSLTFWGQATIAEVYALAALLEVLFLLALLRWREGRCPLWAAAFILGLGLAHHRTSILLIPGATVFWLLSRNHARLPRPKPFPELLAAVVAALLPLLLYLYLPWRAPAWMDSFAAFWQYVMGSQALSAQLDLGHALQLGPQRLWELLHQNIWPQLTPVGCLLALLGVWRLLRRDWAAAALLLISLALVLTFCAVFAVDDVAVFLIPAYVLLALLLGEGAQCLLERVALPARRWLPGVLLLVPIALFWQNLAAIHDSNTTAREQYARSILDSSLPFAAMLIPEWEQVEQLRYLQQIEGLRRDVEVHPLNPAEDRWYVQAALDRGRAVFLLRPWAELGIAQWPEGRLWRVGGEPPSSVGYLPSGAAWADGIVLESYALPTGPYQPGDIVPVAVRWRAEAVPSARYTFFVHLVASDGRVLGQHDREPTQAATDQWQAGQQIDDLYGPIVPLEAPPGRYQVVIGWYQFPSLARLPLRAGGDTLTLGEITVAP